MNRLLDRYVLGVFLPALALFTLALLFLFIAVDCASKLGKFLELQGEPILPFVLHYYLVRIPMLLGILLPSVMLFAPTFTVIKLARSNEILPVATSGISLRRMSLPFISAAFAATLAMAVLDEFVIPLVGDEIVESDDKFSKRGSRYNVEDYNGRTKMSAQRFDIDAKQLSGKVRFTRLDSSMQPVEIVSAERAQWDTKRKRWIAFEGSIEQPQVWVREKGEKPRSKKDPIPPDGVVVESELTPETIRKDVGNSNRFSTAPIRTLIRDMKAYPHVPSKVLLVHSRFSFPLSPIVLLLVGLPFVMDPQSKSFIKGLIFCFLLALGFYVTHFACVELSNNGSIPPIVGAWFPVGSFGLAGLVSFSRMKT